MVSATVAAVVLAPLVRPGYVLRYDMVFTPRQPLRADLFAPADGAPRAVPLDALVSLATVVMPGWLLQRVVLAAILAGAALGAARLVPATRTGTRVVAALCYAWTPFVAERLLLGQWGLLCAYAALPWLVRALREEQLRTERLQRERFRRERLRRKRLRRERLRRGRPALVVAAAAACVTPTGGLVALAVTAVLARGRGWAVAAVAGLNAPWLVAAATAPAGSDPAGVGAFAARAENWGGTLVALAGTGGVWNARAVPASRGSVLLPVFTAGLLVVAGYGLGVLRRRRPGGTGTRLALLGAGSLLLAAAGALPGTAGLLRLAIVHVPGAGLLRDGQKLLLPYALCLALCVALGAERLAGTLAGRTRRTAGGRTGEPPDGRTERTPGGRTGRLVLAGFALLPVALLPDLAWGAGGRLRPVAYPAEWTLVARTVAADPGPVVSLPLSAYRDYPWNPGAVVLDPAGRYLAAPVIADDRLRVGAVTVAGESRAAAEVRDRLAAGRSAAGPDVRWVLVQRGVSGAVPATATAGLVPVHAGTQLVLYRNPRFRAARDGTPLFALAGYPVAAAVLLTALTMRTTRPRG
ncbi:hypothetical protein [Actinoplanes sp. NPDC051851]|uniref:hypothetical protein n=1 Tax=Actinoplanes sp. NPDC051851 TaxID=3154753 RepID=UPI0034335C8B